MRYNLLAVILALLALMAIGCNSHPINNPNPVLESFTMSDGITTVTYHDPAWFQAIHDGVITPQERENLENSGTPTVFFEIDGNTFEWNYDIALAKRLYVEDLQTGQSLNQIPNPDFYEDFPLALKGTDQSSKEQLCTHAAQIIDDAFDWEYEHPTLDYDSCDIYSIFQTVFYTIDNETGFFAQYQTDVLESGRFGMYCPPDPHPEIWCGWDMPLTSEIYGEFIDTEGCPPYTWL